MSDYTPIQAVLDAFENFLREQIWDTDLTDEQIVENLRDLFPLRNNQTRPRCIDCGKPATAGGLFCIVCATRRIFKD